MAGRRPASSNRLTVLLGSVRSGLTVRATVVVAFDISRPAIGRTPGIRRCRSSRMDRAD